MLIRYEDDIYIERATGQKDPEYGRETFAEVWKGKCLYQQGVPVYENLNIRNSVVFILGDIKVRDNDVCWITLTNGRKLRGVAGTVKNVKLHLSGNRRTRIALKQVQDVENGNV